VYVLVAVVAAIAIEPSELDGSTAPLLDVVESSGFAIPSWLFSAIALIAVANGALLTMIMTSRLTYGMSEQRLLPRALSRVLPQRRTPWLAILATTAVAIILTLIGDLALLAETVVLLLLVVFISTNVSVLVLRRDRVEHDHFKVWSFVPVLGVLSCILLMTQQAPRVWLTAGILLAIGALLYAGAKLGAKRRAERRGDAD
jgi:amino acid transporter